MYPDQSKIASHEEMSSKTVFFSGCRAELRCSLPVSSDPVRDLKNDERQEPRSPDLPSARVTRYDVSAFVRGGEQRGQFHEVHSHVFCAAK